MGQDPGWIHLQIRRFAPPAIAGKSTAEFHRECIFRGRRRSQVGPESPGSAMSLHTLIPHPQATGDLVVRETPKTPVTRRFTVADHMPELPSCHSNENFLVADDPESYLGSSNQVSVKRVRFGRGCLPWNVSLLLLWRHAAGTGVHEQPYRRSRRNCERTGLSGGRKMMRCSRWAALAVLVAITVCAGGQTTAEKIPFTYYKLPNGLRVVLSQDSSAPIVAVGVYYQIGFRIEPRDRTGFAHLFEHMMFQGSQNLGKMQFIQLIQKNGGMINGSTRFDFTNYFEVLPANKLETALWAEADRMGGLAVTDANLTNQQGVVGSEVKVNVLNSPYG